MPAWISCKFGLLNQHRYISFKAVPKPLTVFLSTLSMNPPPWQTNTKQLWGSSRRFVWNVGIDTSPLFSEHEVILLMGCRLCSPKFEFARQNESKNLKQFIMLFVPHYTSYHVQFISYLGVLQAIFLIFFPWSCLLLTKLLPPAMVLKHHRELLHYTKAG